MPALRLELLGTARAWFAGREVPLGPPQQRAVLGVLAGHVGDVVSMQHIIDAVWGAEMPLTACNSVHSYVAGLRRSFPRRAGEVITSSSGGYRLERDGCAVDVTDFTAAQNSARSLTVDGRPAEAVDELDAALRLWRGEPYGTIPGPYASTERARLHELIYNAVEEWATAMLAIDRHTEAITTLADCVAREPLRERLHWLLMAALCRCGRQAHGLGAYRRARQLFMEELGIEPGPELRLLHEQILNGTTSQYVCRSLGSLCRPAPLPPPARGFVGRTGELHRLRTLLRGDTEEQAPVLVAVDGPAGVGKSAMVLRVAHDFADRYPDGQFHLDLRASTDPLDTADALGGLLRSMGVAEPSGVNERLAVYRNAVNGRRVLIVLDDVRDAEHVAPLLPNGPACVLVTSRRRQSELMVREGGHRLAVPPMSAVESLDLLARRIGPERVFSQRPAALRLAELSDHLPLVLCMIGEWLNRHAQVSLARALRWYQDEQIRLDQFGLRDLFASAHAELSHEAAELFHTLGQRRPCVVTAESAARLSGTGAPLRSLDALAAEHLLEEWTFGEYRLPPLAAAYAAEIAG